LVSCIDDKFVFILSKNYNVPSFYILTLPVWVLQTPPDLFVKVDSFHELVKSNTLHSLTHTTNSTALPARLLPFPAIDTSEKSQGWWAVAGAIDKVLQ
jgi:hypothetical protein